MNGTGPSVLQDGFYLVARIENGVVKPLSSVSQIEESPEKQEKRPMWMSIGSMADRWECTVKDLFDVSLRPEYAQFFQQERGFWFVRDDFVMPQKDKDAISTAKSDGYEWLTIADFATTNNVSRTALYDRKNSGKWGEYFKTEGKTVYVRSDLPKKPHGGARISVICKETGKTYKSINDACRASGLTYPEVKRSLSTGKKCGGYHFTYAT